MRLFIKVLIDLGFGFYRFLKFINKKKFRSILEYLKCFLYNLVFYINFVYIYSYDFKYFIKIGKKIKIKVVVFIFLVNVYIERK